MMTATKRVDRFIGMHFFNPVPMMKLVEVVGTITTAPAVLDETMKFAESIGKVPIRTTDRSGFIVNRLLVPYLLDAVRALEEGVGTVEDIDKWGWKRRSTSQTLCLTSSGRSDSRRPRC
jgi:3-hydroxybutyryl-CoA dehydrogenase